MDFVLTILEKRIERNDAGTEILYVQSDQILRDDGSPLASAVEIFIARIRKESVR